ncbi:MAG: uroporphyrinogen-III synthase [Corynebacterium sp.]|nr:uroporphyrinogen-III synthase [Corynebacterium sp.]
MTTPSTPYIIYPRVGLDLPESIDGVRILPIPFIETMPVNERELAQLLNSARDASSQSKNPTNPTSKNLSTPFSAIIFASSAAVKACHGVCAQLPAGMRVIAVGKATAGAVRELFGCEAKVAQPSNVEGVIAMPVEVFGAGPVLYPRTEFGGGVANCERLVAGLGARGIEVRPVVAYQTVLREFSEGEKALLRAAAGIAFTSGSTVQAYVNALGAAVPERTIIGCIGPRTATELSRRGMRADVIAPSPSAMALVRALCESVPEL